MDLDIFFDETGNNLEDLWDIEEARVEAAFWRQVADAEDNRYTGTDDPNE